MEQVGRYRITGELGRGAMGVVYRAEDPTIGRTVAIKTIRITQAASEEERKFLRDRLFREARAAGILSHPGIVTIYDIQEENDVCYVFMEYVDGPALEKIMSGPEPMDRELIIRVLQRTAEALDFAHSKGIVHRDIKPGNIMLSSQGEVKITDFGVAVFTSQQATSAGLLLGTPGYMSPEQISDKPTSGSSDQFSLAVIAYQLLTGERPFGAVSLPSLMFKIVNEDPLPIPRLNPTLGNAVDVVLRKALSKKPADRYPTCAAFTNALAAACETKRGWQPMRVGALHSQETVGEAAPAPISVTPNTPVDGASHEPSHLPSHVPSHIPAMTHRIETTAGPGTTMRIRLAEQEERKRSAPWLGFLAAAVVGFLLVGGIVYFVTRSRRVGPSEASTAVAEAPAIAVNDDQKPSAMGPQVAKAETPATEAGPASSGPASSSNDRLKPQTAAPTPVSLSDPPRSTSAASGELAVRVVTNPPGAKLMFDGQPSQMCTAPCERTLENGRHTLAAIADGYRSQHRIFNFPQDREIVIVLDRSFGTVMANSTPAGASIVVDGKERPEKTPAMLTLATGSHKLEFSKEGFSKQVHEIEVSDGAVNKVDVRWGSQ